MFNSADLQCFLADFGEPCVSGGVSFTGVFDQPDELFDLGRATAHSREYQLTYITSAVTLLRNQTVTVAGVAYTVREAPRQQDDGAFSTVLLSKT